jgi:hypothetical protein
VRDSRTTRLPQPAIGHSVRQIGKKTIIPHPRVPQLPVEASDKFQVMSLHGQGNLHVVDKIGKWISLMFL